MKLTAQPLAPFGAELAEIDISTAEDSDIHALKLLLAEAGVVVFRQQSISDTEFVSFLKRLGSLTFTVGEQPVAGEPWLNLVSNIGRSSPPRSVFHTDTSYIAQPPAYTALKAVALPETGGATLFSNQYRAYETLSSRIKLLLSGAALLHVASGVTLERDQESSSWHPLFRRHPISRKTALFLSTPERCQAIQGQAIQKLDLASCQQVIRLLYRHSIRAARLYQHRWQPNDILIWDNRCTMHRADHSGVVGERILHRGLVAGEAPIAGG